MHIDVNIAHYQTEVTNGSSLRVSCKQKDQYAQSTTVCVEIFTNLPPALIDKIFYYANCQLLDRGYGNLAKFVPPNLL